MGKIFDRIHEKIKTSEQQRRDKKAEDAKLKEAAHVAEQEAYTKAYVSERVKVAREKGRKKARAGAMGSLGGLGSIGSFVASHPMDTEKVGRMMGGSSAFDLGMGPSKKGKKSALEKELGL